MQGFLNSVPVVFSDQNSVGTRPGNQDWFVISGGVIKEPAELFPSLAGLHGLHTGSVRSFVRQSKVMRGLTGVKRKRTRGGVSQKVSIPRSRRPLSRFLVLSRAAEWVQFPDPKESFPGAAYISGTGTIIFNIGGNKYRLVARVDFEDQSVYI